MQRNEQKKNNNAQIERIEWSEREAATTSTAEKEAKTTITTTASYEGKHLCNYIHASNRNNALGSRRLDKKHFHKTTITILIIQLHK